MLKAIVMNIPRVCRAYWLAPDIVAGPCCALYELGILGAAAVIFDPLMVTLSNNEKSH
jgi:hypothetical protein